MDRTRIGFTVATAALALVALVASAAIMYIAVFGREAGESVVIKAPTAQVSPFSSSTTRAAVIKRFGRAPDLVGRADVVPGLSCDVWAGAQGQQPTAGDKFAFFCVLG